MALAVVATGSALLAGSATGEPASAGPCAGGDYDFNGDGVRDTVIADPEATVNGQPGAGQVTVVYGDGQGVVQLHQDLTWVPGMAEAGDAFGFSLASYDRNQDGCADLVIGAPFEGIADADEAGSVWTVFGSHEGIGPDTGAESQNQSNADVPGAAEPGDLYGYALAAGETASHDPFLVVGVPGEDIGSVTDAGLIHYEGSGINANVHQDSAGVPGVAEPHDRLGASLSATAERLAVGSPGEAIGDKEFAGGVQIFDHAPTSGAPTPLGFLNQSAGPAAAEAGDRFGTAVALVPHPDGAGASYLAVGAPGEDVGSVGDENYISDGGSVAVFDVAADGTAVPMGPAVLQERSPGPDRSDAGDFLGQTVAATVHNGVLHLAIGVPGEEAVEDTTDHGGVLLATVTGTGVSGTRWFAPGHGLPSTAGDRMYTGTAVAAAPGHFLVGAAYESPGTAPGAVYTIPWDAPDGGAPSARFAPGEGGIPAGGTAFGSAVR
ncbi:integrin alpha [Streptomyces aidingensis]|uniref:integrin alpha n=1 Tax=Streptomyces aidingensis TaxID=910347 RepID=UPI000B871113|nr:integrin alpha [Streptomyces aidingensis]